MRREVATIVSANKKLTVMLVLARRESYECFPQKRRCCITSRLLKLSRMTQRVAYKVTTKRKHSDAVADNLLNQNFNPLKQESSVGGQYYLFEDR